MITKEQFQLLDSLYDYYNKELFEGQLKDCMITTSRKKRVRGFFAPEMWKNKELEKYSVIHEISLNPDFLHRKDEEWQSTLVHEMVHLWQKDLGNPSRGGYHNREWADKMQEIGLMPSNTGLPEGKKTGQQMTHYIMTHGLFIKAFKSVSEKIKYISSDILIGASVAKKTSVKLKTKYTCPCNNNVWGKPDLLITCDACKQSFIQAE